MAWDLQGNLRGPRGTIWWKGKGPPVAANLPNALPGDFYIDTDTQNYYNLS